MSDSPRDIRFGRKTRMSVSLALVSAGSLRALSVVLSGCSFGTFEAPPFLAPTEAPRYGDLVVLDVQPTDRGDHQHKTYSPDADAVTYNAAIVCPPRPTPVSPRSRSLRPSRPPPASSSSSASTALPPMTRRPSRSERQPRRMTYSPARRASCSVPRPTSSIDRTTTHRPTSSTTAHREWMTPPQSASPR